MSYYIAILDGGGDVWGVRVPDFPGCHGGGPTPEAAILDASSALAAIAADMERQGEPIPEPRPFTEAMEALAPGEAAVLIPLATHDARREPA